MVEDIYKANLSECHIDILEQYKIRAFLVVPLFLGQELWGLLGAYQHSAPKSWARSEIDFVLQVAAHVGSALQQNKLFALAQSKAQQVPAWLTDKSSVSFVEKREHLKL